MVTDLPNYIINRKFFIKITAKPLTNMFLGNFLKIYTKFNNVIDYVNIFIKCQTPKLNRKKLLINQKKAHLNRSIIS